MPIHPSHPDPRRPAARRGTLLAIAWLALAGPAALPASAQMVSLGSQFAVSAPSECAAYLDVASAEGGRFVVVWSTKTLDLRARRYDAAGAPLGQVQTLQSGDVRWAPSVGIDAGGGFVVVWQVPRPGQTLDSQILGRRFDAQGNALGQVFTIGHATGDDRDPKVAVDRSGAFVVAWVRDAGNGASIEARRYDAQGSPQGTIFTVEPTGQDPSLPDIGIERDGGSFVVAWQQQAQSGDISARRFGAQGTALGPSFTVNAYTTGTQESPAVSVAADGSFGVTWIGEAGQGRTTVLSLFDDAGSFLAEAPIRTGTRFPVSPALAMTDDGGSWLTTWTDVDFTQPVFFETFVQGTANLLLDVPIPSQPTNYEFAARVAVDGQSRAVAAWLSDPDLDDCNQPYARRLRLVRHLHVLAESAKVHGFSYQGAWTHFVYHPQSQGTVRVVLSGLPEEGPNDADLYVRLGEPPELGAWDCRPYSGGNSSETCTLDSKGAPVFVAVNGYQPGEITFTLEVEEW